MSELKKIYFASDFHLGDEKELSKERERLIVRWLDEIKVDAKEIYLVGDIFDFWFEYKMVVPKGYTRFLGKLAELSDSGVRIHIFTGNHDVWMFNYLQEELGIQIYYKPICVELDNHKFYIGHGDGLGPGDHGYKFIKRIFTNKIAQWLFARLHPNLALTIMHKLSDLSREDTSKYTFKGNDEEWLVQFCKEKVKEIDVDYFIFGHRHIDLDIQVPNSNSRYINLGEWMHRRSYAVYDGKKVILKHFER